MARNPFPPSASKPGHGTIQLSLLPPSNPVLQTLSYHYPLKLIAPSSLPVPSSPSSIVHSVFLLTYGGGLVAGDAITLTITLAATTRLILLTQGSTKIYKSLSPSIVSRQTTITTLQPGAALVYLPDPVQPFDRSAFEQVQIYYLVGTCDASLCVCDWVSEGRSARGEKWGCWKYGSRTEIWATDERPDAAKKRLLLRDYLILDSEGKQDEGLAGNMDSLGVFGTLILHGPLLANLGDYFLQEFKKLPRIGGQQWDKAVQNEDLGDKERRSAARVKREKDDGLLWTAAPVRGSVVVKFGAREVEGARTWLRTMLKEEGSVEKEFGERALLCLR